MQNDAGLKRFVVLIGCGALFAGLLGGAFVFTEAGWRGVLTCCAVLALSTAAELLRLRS